MGLPIRASEAKEAVSRTILCIDDDRETYQILEEGLAGEDCQILYSDDPAEALELIGEYELDLVVTEILLRKGDGLEMLEEILANEEDDAPPGHIDLADLHLAL